MNDVLGIPGESALIIAGALFFLVISGLALKGRQYGGCLEAKRPKEKDPRRDNIPEEFK